MELKIRIFPKKKGHWFWLPNETFEFVRDYKSPFQAGWVYSFLAKSADNQTQTSWWSVSGIGEQAGLSISSVNRCLHFLEKRHMIGIYRVHSKSSVYILFDKREWSPVELPPVSQGTLSCMPEIQRVLSMRRTNNTNHSDFYNEGYARALLRLKADVERSMKLK